MMHCFQRYGNYFSVLVLSFAGVTFLLRSVSDAAPPKVAPPEPFVDKDQFSKAKLEFKDAQVKDDHLILEMGKKYKYTGSFQLADPDEDERYLTPRSIQRTLNILFVVDGEKSGFGPPRPEAIDPIYVIITQSGGRPSKLHVDESNILHFEGETKVPRSIGEHQLRLNVTSREPHARVFVLTRLVTVVEPEKRGEPKAANNP